MFNKNKKSKNYFVLKKKSSNSEKNYSTGKSIKRRKWIVILAVILLLGFFVLISNTNDSLKQSIKDKIESFVSNAEISLFSSGDNDEVEPQLVLTKTAMKDGEEIQNIVYDENLDDYTFTYRLKLENIVENSTPAVITETQTVTDILPEGITVYGTLPSGVTVDTVEVDGVSRERITWTVSNIGYGENAKYVDITVSISVDVFKNQEIDLETGTTIVDIQLSTGNSNMRK